MKFRRSQSARSVIAIVGAGIALSLAAACGGSEKNGNTEQDKGAATDCTNRCAAIATKCNLDSKSCGNVCQSASEKELGCMETTNCNAAAYDACVRGDTGQPGGGGNGSDGGTTDAGPPDAKQPDPGPTGCLDLTKTIPCGSETCKVTEICVHPTPGSAVTDLCQKIPADDQCTPCSTQSRHIPSSYCDRSMGYTFKLNGSANEGCTATCQ